MNVDRLELRLDPVVFHGDRDENNFFGWLESIPGFQGFVGRGEEMLVFFDQSLFTPHSFLELLRFFMRYRIDRGRLVPLLSSLPEAERSKYADPESPWHDALFGPL